MTKAEQIAELKKMTGEELMAVILQRFDMLSIDQKKAFIDFSSIVAKLEDEPDPDAQRQFDLLEEINKNDETGWNEYITAQRALLQKLGLPSIYDQVRKGYKIIKKA